MTTTERGASPQCCCCLFSFFLLSVVSELEEIVQHLPHVRGSVSQVFVRHVGGRKEDLQKKRGKKGGVKGGVKGGRE